MGNYLLADLGIMSKPLINIFPSCKYSTLSIKKQHPVGLASCFFVNFVLYLLYERSY